MTEALCAALAWPLPGAWWPACHHAAVHRWRLAAPVRAEAIEPASWRDASLGLGACGDSFGSGTVEAAWCSGDEFAEKVAATLDVRSAGRVRAALKTGTTSARALASIEQGAH